MIDKDAQQLELEMCHNRIRKLERQIEDAREVIAFYADENQWEPHPRRKAKEWLGQNPK